MSPPDPFGLPVSASDLRRLEETLAKVVLWGDPFVDEIATHLIAAGGKRLRPVLTLAAASGSGSPVSEEAVLGAVSVELVHLASLYHDDVMDEATERRNVVSVNGRWGNLLAVVVGDFLLARSAEIAASLGTEIAGILATTLGRLTQGQVAEVRSAYRIDRSEDAYFSAIADKTGALMATSCRIGAITGGLDTRDAEALTDYGENLGIVFQIRDDILDVIASEGEAGKPPGQDLAEGIYTLPVQRALSDADVGTELRSILGKPLDPAEVGLARRLVTDCDAINSSRAVASAYADKAAHATNRISDTELARALSELGGRLVDDIDRSRRAFAS
ncbi:MAG: polyprenyl synthetase family protein [Acidimicrobiales bacterium]